MNMSPPVSQKSYDCITKKIKCVIQAFAEKWMKTAAMEENKLLEALTNVYAKTVTEDTGAYI